MKITSLFITLIGFLVFNITAQDTRLEDCYIRKSGDTLTVGNDLIERQWIWNGGNLVPLNLKNKGVSPAEEMVFNYDQDAGKAAQFSDFKSLVVEEDAVTNAHLLAEVIAGYDNYEQKTLIRIYPETPVIKVEYAFKKTADGLSLPKLNEMALDMVILPSIHYTLTTVQYYDRTDVNNNLVFKDELLPYLRMDKKVGNILFARENAGKESFFLLKEAPCSYVQLNYPGFDFLIHNREIKVVGTGLKEESLEQDKWISTYSSVTGIAPEGQTLQHALRTYQKNLRKYDFSRDDMIMLNTWGDRNRDQSINEAFCLQEIDACKKYGITHFQIDDGWQRGRSKNSADPEGELWDAWEKEDWQPDPEKFPSGFDLVSEYAEKNDVELGLWFHPSNHNSYENWKQDAEIVAGLYSDYDVRYFKIDGIKLPDKEAEVNFRKFLDHALMLSQNNIVFNLDATADNRGGYHFLNEYGNIFLENRYTDWGNYYPHWTLRNLWQLSEYVPPEKLQIEFLNKWRNPDKYPENDPLAPINIPFEYSFAVTMAAQPLAWFEAGNLPEEAAGLIPLIENYKTFWNDFHRGYIFPIGEMPDGYKWTGFQSIHDDYGYILIFRELNNADEYLVETYLKPGDVVEFLSLAGSGEDFSTIINEDNEVPFRLPDEFSFALYRYTVVRE